MKKQIKGKKIVCTKIVRGFFAYRVKSEMLVPTVDLEED